MTGWERISEDYSNDKSREVRFLPGSVRRTWLQLAANLRRPRNSLTIPIGYNSFREATRVATIIFTCKSCSPIIIPAAVVATVPAAMKSRTVISTNDDGVCIRGCRDGNDGRKSDSDSKNDILHGALPRFIRPRLNDCRDFTFHKKSHFGLQSEEASDHWRSFGQSLIVTRSSSSPCPLARTHHPDNWGLTRFATHRSRPGNCEGWMAIT